MLRLPAFCHLTWIVALPLLMSGCGSITPVWTASCEELINTKTLYYQSPCEYQFNPSGFMSPGPYTLEFTLTYYSQIGRTELPLFLSFESASHDIQEFFVTIPLKKDGKDLGVPQQNEIDFTITHTAVERIDLLPESYVLRVFFDGERMMEDEAEGILGLEARLYNADDYAETDLP